MLDMILVIDDDVTLIGLIEEYLNKAGYHTLTAPSGVAGLQAFHEHRPDLVVLDVMMPKMDGWKVCERMREISDVPIIMLTAKGVDLDQFHRASQDSASFIEHFDGQKSGLSRRVVISGHPASSIEHCTDDDGFSCGRRGL